MRFIRKHNLINILSATGIRVLVTASVMLGSVLVLYSGYSLYEQLYTQNRAFTTAGLDYEGDEVLDDDVQAELSDMYEDYRAWLRIDDTHIDYPVMQSKDDLYYANHDIDGKSSLTGALYMTYENAPDMSDDYIVVFGHHMDNGAMFGDLDHFEDPKYFNEHQKGSLATPNGIYDITVWAVLRTDAYEASVYGVKGRNLSDIIDYVTANALYMDVTATAGAEKIIAMSTCSDVLTNGRLVVFGVLKPTVEPIEPTTEETTPEESSEEESTPEESTEEESTPEESTEEQTTPEESTEEQSTEEITTGEASSEAVTIGPYDESKTMEPTTPDGTVPPDTAAGTGVNEKWPIFSDFFDWFMPGGSSYGRDCWAFVNLLCLIITVYILAPVNMMKRKYGRIRKMRKINEAKNEQIYDVEPFARRFHTGVIIESVLTVLALIVFILTENMRLPMILIDKWTPMMLILMVGSWVAEVTLTRYRRDEREDEKVKQENE